MKDSAGSRLKLSGYPVTWTMTGATVGSGNNDASGQIFNKG
jgi:hypothetical protein